jgi:hypothetical protein
MPHLPSLDIAPPTLSCVVWHQVPGELLGLFDGGDGHRQPAKVTGPRTIVPH